MTMEDLIGVALTKRPAKEGYVVRWESDGQEGGRLIYLTPEQAAEFDRLQEKEHE